MAYENIQTETKGRVGIIRLNRPKALNALCADLVRELGQALDAFEADPGIGCLVLTGSEKAFAAGADIKEMQRATSRRVFRRELLHRRLAKIAATRKPWIAAVAGFALGGGCELAMTADFIIAADTARFGQPEVKLGVAPGIGGSQRLARAVGKSKAMEMVLTGRMMKAEEAERANLVVRVVPAAELLESTLKTAQEIAAMPPLATIANKEMVNWRSRRRSGRPDL